MFKKQLFLYFFTFTHIWGATEQ